MTDQAVEPSWQCVMVCWGEKYPASLINHLVETIAKFAASEPRFVLITDRDHPQLLAKVQTRRFPEFFYREPMRRSGCQAKLAMFEEGLLPTDLPAVYVDLDTVVSGDIGQLIGLMRDRRSVLMLQSAIVPFGPVGRLLWRLSGGKRYARGNSSVMAFHPAECAYIARRFRELDAQYPDFGFRPMIADERFISWVAQPHMIAVPKSFAVKFPTEFMFPWRPWLYVRALLPWVRRRREQLVAVTLNGMSIKPEKLIALEDGAIVVDEKGRSMVWSERTMGANKAKIAAFYAGVVGQ